MLLVNSSGIISLHDENSHIVLYIFRPVTTGTGREQYQRQLEQLRMASVELESSRDDYRVKVDELNSELMELRKKVTIILYTRAERDHDSTHCCDTLKGHT